MRFNGVCHMHLRKKRLTVPGMEDILLSLRDKTMMLRALDISSGIRAKLL